MKSPVCVRPISTYESSFLFLRMAFECLEGDFPESLELFQLLDRVPHCSASRRSQLVNPFAPVFPRPYQTGPDEQSSVLANGWATDRKPGGELTGTTGRVRQSTQNLSASRVT